MAKKFTVIPENTFDELQLDAGVLLTTFDPATPVAPADSAIICATTGGINVSCVPTFSDLGEDVDNVPVWQLCGDDSVVDHVLCDPGVIAFRVQRLRMHCSDPADPLPELPGELQCIRWQHDVMVHPGHAFPLW